MESEIPEQKKRKSPGNDSEQTDEPLKKHSNNAGIEIDLKSSPRPHVILLFSGKRKSGKDYVTDILQEQIGKEVCTILRLSGPLKAQYAKDHNLNLNKLLDATEYKEKYRADMIKWGEEKRSQDPGYFCSLATANIPANFHVWIISDIRRKTDLKYFQQHFLKETVTVRVEAKNDVRESRGFVFTKGVDDAESECNLDEGINWDFTVHNNGDKEILDTELRRLVECVQERIREGKGSK